MKKIIIAIILVGIAMSNKIVVNAPANNSYKLNTIVVATNKQNDVVIVEDKGGNLWEFDGVEDWLVGDICELTMFDNGTENIVDDEISATIYKGYEY